MMRALTLIRPWCWAIACGHKPWENRGWAPHDSVLGTRIALHSGMKFDGEAATDIIELLPAGELPPTSVVWRGGYIHATAIVRGYFEHDGSGLVTQCVGMEVTEASASARISPWVSREPGIAWLMTEPLVLKEPVACKGALGLWTVPAAIEVMVREQIARAA